MEGKKKKGGGRGEGGGRRNQQGDHQGQSLFHIKTAQGGPFIHSRMLPAGLERGEKREEKGEGNVI